MTTVLLTVLRKRAADALVSLLLLLVNIPNGKEEDQRHSDHRYDCLHVHTFPSSLFFYLHYIHNLR